MNTKLLAPCGLHCGECPAYLHTQAGDEAGLKETAAKWAEEIGLPISADEIWCDGCLAAGRKCSYCQECGIRDCAMSRNYQHCGQCEELPCSRLKQFHGTAIDRHVERLRSAGH
ncbi:MAG: DUF3795 domain-containing protein [Bacillota bacterium]